MHADTPTMTREQLQHALGLVDSAALSAFGRRGRRPFFAVPGTILMLDAKGEVMLEHGDRFLTRADLHCFPIEELVQHVARVPRPMGSSAVVLAVALRLDGDLFDAVSGTPDHLLCHGVSLSHADAGFSIVARHHHCLSEAAKQIKPSGLAIDRHHERLRSEKPARGVVLNASNRTH